MTDDVMRLVAEITDKFSAPLKEMQRQLRALSDANKKSQKEGIDSSRHHFESFRNLNDMVRRTAQSMRGDFMPAMDAVASSATGVGAAIAVVVAGIGSIAAASKNFAEAANKLQGISRLSAIEINKLQPLLQIGPQIGTSVDTMANAFEGLANHLERLQRFPPSELALWSGKSVGQVQAFVAGLQGISASDAFDKIIHFAQSMNPQMREQFYAMFDLPPGLAKKTEGELDAIIKLFKDHTKQFTEAQVQAGIDANLKWQLIGYQFQQFALKFGADWAETWRDALGAFSKFLDDAPGAVSGYFQRIKSSLSNEDRQAIADGFAAIRAEVSGDVASLVASLPKDLKIPGPEILAPETLARDIHAFIQDAKDLNEALNTLTSSGRSWAQSLGDWRKLMDATGVTEVVNKFLTLGKEINDIEDSWVKKIDWSKLWEGWGAAVEAAKAEFVAFKAWFASWTTDLLPTIDWGKMFGGLTSAVNSAIAEFDRIKAAVVDFQNWFKGRRDEMQGKPLVLPPDLVPRPQRQDQGPLGSLRQGAPELEQGPLGPLRQTTPAPAPAPPSSEWWGALRQNQSWQGGGFDQGGIIKASLRSLDNNLTRGTANDNAAPKPTSEAINAIATGTRKGVYDGLFDFTAMKGDAAGGGAGAGGNVNFTGGGATAGAAEVAGDAGAGGGLLGGLPGGGGVGKGIAGLLGGGAGSGGLPGLVGGLLGGAHGFGGLGGLLGTGGGLGGAAAGGGITGIMRRLLGGGGAQGGSMAGLLGGALAGTGAGGLGSLLGGAVGGAVGGAAPAAMRRMLGGAASGGGHQGHGAGESGAPMPHGSQTPTGGSTGAWWTPDRMRHAADRLTKEAGLSQMGAAGLVARWAGVESRGGPTSVNPRSGAYGIAQWLGSRKAGIAGNPDYDDQLTHVIGELKTTESRAASRLRAATTRGDAATGASMFERAEGYNPTTGQDLFTGKTPVGSVLSAIQGKEGDTQLGVNPVTFGDSIARRIGMAGTIGDNYGVDSDSPANILKRMRDLDASKLKGRNVLLSSGSNNIGDLEDVRKAIEVAKAKGAAGVMLQGVGNRADLAGAGVNEQLRQMAKETGARFEDMGETADQVHPTLKRSREIADDLRKMTGGFSSDAAKRSAGQIPVGFAESPSVLEHRDALQKHFGGGMHAVPQFPDDGKKPTPGGQFPNAPESLPGRHDLLEHARGAGIVASTQAGRVTGDASLTVGLASGLVPHGGIKTTGDLFRETKLNRGAVPMASQVA